MRAKIRILNKKIKPPVYATNGSAGMDLQSAEPNRVILTPNETQFIRTGIAVHIGNRNYMGMIIPKSGLGSKGAVLGNLVGCIDSDYQGEIMVNLWNRTDEPLVIDPFTWIAQLIIVPVERVDFDIVQSFDKTERAEGGFGSTGSAPR